MHEQDDEYSERGKGRKEERGFIVSAGRRRAYVPSTSESKRQWRKKRMGGRRGRGVGRGGWVKGRKDRMKRERRPDQTQAVRAGTKRKNSFRS